MDSFTDLMEIAAAILIFVLAVSMWSRSEEEYQAVLGHLARQSEQTYSVMFVEGE